MACGLAARFVGIYFAINGILILDLPGSRQIELELAIAAPLPLPGHPFQASTVMQDVTFCDLTAFEEPVETVLHGLGSQAQSQGFVSILPRATIQALL